MIFFIISLWVFCVLLSTVDLILIRLSVLKGLGDRIKELVTLINETTEFQNEIYDDEPRGLVSVNHVLLEMLTAEWFTVLRFMTKNCFHHILFRTTYNDVYLSELKEGLNDRYLNSINLNVYEVSKVIKEIKNDGCSECNRSD